MQYAWLKSKKKISSNFFRESSKPVATAASNKMFKPWKGNTTTKLTFGNTAAMMTANVPIRDRLESFSKRNAMFILTAIKPQEWINAKYNLEIQPYKLKDKN